MTLSYLVSTAGHAQHQNEIHPHDIKTILQLIDDGVREFGEEKVVGFVISIDGGWRCDRFSFIDLLDLSNKLANSLSRSNVAYINKGIISLLCPTGLDFLIAWIALMRMGYGIVFIAPQCSPSAIDHLLKSTSSTRLVYHTKYADLAQSVRLIDSATTLVQLPILSSAPPAEPTSSDITTDPDTVSHIFHTSGTSGTPKPIPHTHIGSVSILPCRSLPSYLSTEPQSGQIPAEAAAFTTTPLFHGGVSDVLRAWMARSMIYFYPTSDTPITSDHVVAAVMACQSLPPFGLDVTDEQKRERAGRFRVGSFLSVPYILTILSEDLQGPAMEMLQKLDFVSTGGAPLDTRIGDSMVERGVRLVSRLGSSECGFLLSSHRDYETEHDWEWLRNDSAYSDALVFEAAEENKFEMVVTDKWSSKTKSNREDGSYATGDLYQPHPIKKNVWRYVGRGDDVIVLSNGEKAAPGPIESILRSSPHLSDALVVGSDRPQLGLLLFPRTPMANLLELISPLLVEANHSSPSFAQISTDMCVVVSSGKSLPKSSKETVQRGLANEMFKEEVNQLYGSASTAQNLEKQSVKEIEDRLEELILEITSSQLKVDKLDKETDLFSWGVDSLMATRIRSAIQRSLNTGGKDLPRNIVFEKPSIARLATYIFNLQENTNSDDDENDPHSLMNALVQKYGNFTPRRRNMNHTKASTSKSGKTIVITGDTGSLGAFMLDQLRRLPPDTVEKIICLVRAENDQIARERIAESLKQRGLVADATGFEVYAADLAEGDLGLSAEVYGCLVEEVDIVIHAAWPVHFASSLVSFEDNIKGTRNLLDLVTASHAKARFYYCSSLASVLAQPPNGPILEHPSTDPSTASPIGYSQSKWVTERICQHAKEVSGLENRVRILRIGQLCGDTLLGGWNEKEGWPLLIRTAMTAGCLPLLSEKPSWLPVDLAAGAIIDVITHDQDQDQGERPFVYHIAHPTSIDWEVVLDGLEAAGMVFERVSPKIWLKRVKDSSKDGENPMLFMWEAAYAEEIPSQEVVVDTTNARAASATLRDIRPIGGEEIGLMVEAWRRTGFLR